MSVPVFLHHFSGRGQIFSDLIFACLDRSEKIRAWCASKIMVSTVLILKNELSFREDVLLVRIQESELTAL